MLDGVPDGEYAGHSSVWNAFDLGKSCVRPIEKGKALYRNPMEPCSTLLPIQGGVSIRSSGTQCKSPEMIAHGLCGYSGVMTSSCFCNSSYGWSPLNPYVLEAKMPTFGGVVPGGSPLRGWFQVVPISCRRCLNHRIVVCGTSKRLAPFAILKLVCSIQIILSLLTMVRS